MGLVTSTEMFKKAYEGHYAIGAFNVNNMEIIQGITEAAAEVKARQMSAEAENEGKAAVEAARAKADSELTELRKQADAKAMTEAGELSAETENRKAALRARAEARLEKAAALVVERIVNS